MRRHDVVLAALQAVGAVCFVVSVWHVHDGWWALGAFGLALIALCQFIDRHMSG
jgi:hypothetical protein